MYQEEINAMHLGAMNSKVPPSWSPEKDKVYPLRTWIADIRLWSVGTDVEVLKQGPVAAGRILGTARDLIRELDPNVLVNGGVFNDGNGQPAQFSGLECLIRALSRRYAPLAQELEIFCIGEILNFARHPGEDTDSCISRFELVRTRAFNGAGFDMSWVGFSYLVLSILGVHKAQWPVLLAPTQGSLPNNQQQYTDFCNYIRRHGHMTDRGVDSVKNMNFFATNSADDHGMMITPVYHGTATWNAPQHWANQGFYASDGFDQFWDAGVYLSAEVDSEISSCNSGESEPDISDLHVLPYNVAGEKLYLAYRHHKRRWRKFTGGFKRRSGKGKGKGHKGGKRFSKGGFHKGSSFSAGKGAGKGKSGGKGRMFYVDEWGYSTEVDTSDSSWPDSSYPVEASWPETEPQEAIVLLGKGKFKRKNPKGKDGKTLLCSGCNSDEHFVKDCPRNPKNLGSSPMQSNPKSFTTAQSPESVASGSNSSSGWGSSIYLGHQQPVDINSKSLITFFDGSVLELDTPVENAAESVEPARNYYMPQLASKPSELSQSSSSHSDIERKFAFVWFMPPAFHAQVKIAAGEALLIDPGAFDNLVGSKVVDRVSSLAQAAGHGCAWQKLKQQLSVEGVGKGADHSSDAVLMPVCLADGTPGTYFAPVIPDSELPALLGLKTLSKYRALIDTHNKQLIFVGEGGYKLQLSPGSKAFQLHSAKTGHLMLPCCCWKDARIKPGQPGLAL